MYKIKTKDDVEKPIDSLTQQEIEEAIRFNNIKKRQKEEQIEQARKNVLKLQERENKLTLAILDLAEEKDEVQRKIDYKLKYISDESFRQQTIETILFTLQQLYDKKTHFVEFSYDKISELQLNDIKE